MTNKFEWKWQGKYKITVINKKLKKIVARDIVLNTITNSARDEIIKPLYNGGIPDIDIKYLAIGTGTSASSSGDTKLGVEVFRTVYNGLDRLDTGVVQADFAIQDTDYDGAIEEIGIFCGSSATGTADTGLLLSRIRWSYDKGADEEIYLQRVDTIGG